MESKDRENFQTTYQVLNKLYNSIKKLSKPSDSEKKNVSASVKEDMNDLMDQAIKKIDWMMMEKTDKNLRLIAMKMTIFYERSKLLMSLGDENMARETLTTAFNIIREISSEPEVIFLSFRIINHQAYLLTKQNDFEAAKRILERGKEIYDDVRNKKGVVKFFTSDDLFSPEEIALAAPEANSKLERLVTSNLQMLCFVYNKLGCLDDIYIARHHELLERQLDSKNEDLTAWAMQAAKLASFFLSWNKFELCRHHLCAAVYVLEEYEKNLDTTKPDYNEKFEDLRRNFAEVGKYWVKYGLCLFNVSRGFSVARLCSTSNLERIWTTPFESDDKNVSSVERSNQDFAKRKTSRNFHQDSFSSRSELSPSTNLDSESNLPWIQNQEESKHFNFDFKSLKNLPEYENQVSATLIETTAQARSLFLFTHGWLKRVKSFYNLNEYPMEYVNTILDLSELYRYLAFYEEDIESQYTVQKLRADALETMSTVLREIRPQCYAVSIELLRELAEVQMEMMGLNLRRIYATKESGALESEEIGHKINAFADIHSRLKQFRDTFDIQPRDEQIISQTVESNDFSQLFT